MPRGMDNLELDKKEYVFKLATDNQFDALCFSRVVN